MKNHNKIPYWENHRRQKLLSDFRLWVQSYFDDSRPDPLNIGVVEGDQAQSLRPKINKWMSEIHQIIIAADVYPVMQYTPPPIIGGFRQDINVIDNIFEIYRLHVGPNSIYDFIDRALGIYQQGEQSSKIRTFNPFFWVGELFEWIAIWPFRILKQAGFDGDAIEKTSIGKMIRLMIYLIEALAALLTVFQLTGLLSKLANWCRS